MTDDIIEQYFQLHNSKPVIGGSFIDWLSTTVFASHTENNDLGAKYPKLSFLVPPQQAFLERTS